MRKWILFFMIMLLITGCASQTSPSMNPQEIMQGDFSSIAGTYTNPKGDTIQLDEDGLRWNERQTSEIHCSNYGICTMGIHVAGQGEGGYSLTVYPVGIHVPGLKTDTDKIRIVYGQAEPMSEDEIYTYSSNKLQPVEIESDYQAFIMKEYYDVLFEISLPHGLFNPHLDSNQITFIGPDIDVNYSYDLSLYNMSLSKEVQYAKGEPKRAEATISVQCDKNQNLYYTGSVKTNDGQSFVITYDDINQIIINNNISSDSFGQPIKFVDSLHTELIKMFEEAKTISKLQYPVLHTWQNELNEVRNKSKTYYDIQNARDKSINESSLIKVFEDKNYSDVLTQCFRGETIVSDIEVNNQSIILQGYDRSAFYYPDQLYNLQITHDIFYTKDEQEKYGTLYITASCAKNRDTNYTGRFILENGETFYLIYDKENELIINNETGSETHGQPIQFVSSLNRRLIAEFKTAQTIIELQYPVFSTWMQEVQMVKEGTKTINEIKDAYEIPLNLDILDIEFDESMDDFVMTDPCASAIELVECYLYQVQKAIELHDFDSIESNDSIFWDALTMAGFEGSEHFPYQHLVRRNDNYLFVFTLEDMQQYAYELYGFKFEPYIPYEWSSMYKPALQRYESYLEFGIHGEAPDTFRVENINAKQDGTQIIVYFDVVWFEVDDQWMPLKDIRVQSAESKFMLMNENGHSFLRHIYTDFSE